MSSISNNDKSDCLVLDFGIYSSSKTLRNYLDTSKKNQILELNPIQMKAADWDHVLDLIINNNKCIIL